LVNVSNISIRQVGVVSPAPMRWDTMWHSMQSGPGVFKGGAHFYVIDDDIRDRVDDIDIKSYPLVLPTAEYDYSCTSEATLEIAKRRQLR